MSKAKPSGSDQSSATIGFEAKLWLAARKQACLCDVRKNIFESGELTREATVSKMEIVRTEGGREVVREVARAAATA